MANSDSEEEGELPVDNPAQEHSQGGAVREMGECVACMLHLRHAYTHVHAHTW